MMVAFDFVPDEPAVSQVKVPFIEDARADFAPGYRTNQTEAQLQAEVVELITRLGGGAASFQSGAFGGAPKRYGYIIAFSIMSAEGQGINCRMHIAGLPMRTETAVKKSRVMRQALFAFAGYLRGELNALVFRPGYSPFVPHMIGNNGRTLVEEMVERHKLLMLGG